MNSPILVKSRCNCPKPKPGEGERKVCRCIKNMTRNPVTFEPIWYNDQEDPDEIIFRQLGRHREIDTWTNHPPVRDDRPERPQRKGRAKPRNRHPERD